MLDIIARYIALYPLFSTKAFLINLFKKFEEQAEDFFNHFNVEQFFSQVPV